MFRLPTNLLRCVLLLCLGAASGCGTLRLPAIDPTGERFFLPDPNYTTFVSPYDSGGQYSCLPSPAFTEPPPIPPCAGDMPMGPGYANAQPPAPPQAKLLLTPAKIVAPINSEVILLAGICGPDGHYICKQPIEWMLSPDSVGNIHGLADSPHPMIAKLANHSPHKDCSTLATTRTLPASHLITRGTTEPNDDVFVGKGQTWIAVSSPTEGVSHVTALARGEDNWDFRRQTATIHWVDLQWAFPSPQIVRAGQPGSLSTAVTRTSTGAAATGILVRYDIIDGTPASFFGEGRMSLELQTNENGRADVQVVQTQPGPGSTKVRVRILSSDLRASGSDRAVIGEGYTTVTWSAPGLTVTVQGPGSLARGSVGTYRVDVANPGDVTTRDVQLAVDLPQAIKYLNSQPAGEVFGNRLVWRLGDLGPKQVFHLDVNCQAANAGEIRMAARAASPDATEAVGIANTRIVESSLAVRFVDPPQAAAVGQAVGFNFEITNTGDTPLRNILVRDRFDAGLEPNYPEKTSPLEMGPFALGPRETRRQSISFIARAPGQLCHNLEATAEGGHTASDRACVEVAQPTLQVEVTKAGPDQARVGDEVPFTINVVNTGDGQLTNVWITDIPDQNLTPIQGSRGFQAQDGRIAWRVDVLGPNQMVKLEMVCRCEAENPAATNTVEVTADGGIRKSTSARLAIGPRPTRPPVENPPVTPPPVNPPNTNPPVTPNNQNPPAVTGEFTARLVGLTNGVRVGEQGTFYVFLKNTQNIPENDVVVTFQVSDGLEVTGHTWSAQLPVLSNPNDRRVLEVGPIRTIGENQTTLQPIRFTIVGTKPGNYKVTVSVRSRRLQQPITQSVDTFVSAK